MPNFTTLGVHKHHAEQPMKDIAARLEELLNHIWSEKQPLPWNQKTALIFQKAFHQEGVWHTVITYALKVVRQTTSCIPILLLASLPSTLALSTVAYMN